MNGKMLHGNVVVQSGRNSIFFSYWIHARFSSNYGERWIGIFFFFLISEINIFHSSSFLKSFPIQAPYICHTLHSWLQSVFVALGQHCQSQIILRSLAQTIWMNEKLLFRSVFDNFLSLSSISFSFHMRPMTDFRDT